MEAKNIDEAKGIVEAINTVRELRQASVKTVVIHVKCPGDSYTRSFNLGEEAKTFTHHGWLTELDKREASLRRRAAQIGLRLD